MFESWAMPGSIGQLAFGRRLLAVDVHCCNGVGCVHDGEVGLDPVRLVGVLPLSHVRINVDASGSNAEGNENEGRQLGKMIGVAVQSELIRQKRPGGILA